MMKTRKKITGKRKRIEYPDQSYVDTNKRDIKRSGKKPNTDDMQRELNEIKKIRSHRYQEEKIKLIHAHYDRINEVKSRLFSINLFQYNNPEDLCKAFNETDLIEGISTVEITLAKISADFQQAYENLLVEMQIIWPDIENTSGELIISFSAIRDEINRFSFGGVYQQRFTAYQEILYKLANLKVEFNNLLRHSILPYLQSRNSLVSENIARVNQVDQYRPVRSVTSLIEFSSIILEGKCPKDEILQLNYRSRFVIQTREIKLLCGLLKSGNAPNDLEVTIRNSRLDSNTIIPLVEILQSRGVPEGLKLDLNGNYINDAALKKLAEVLQSGNAPFRLFIDLSYNHSFSSAGIKFLADALASGRAPSGLELNLRGSINGDSGILLLAEAIQSGNAPENLVLDLGQNNISLNAIRTLATALQSGKAPKGLAIDFFWNNLGFAGAQVIANLLKSRNTPVGLQIGLNFCNLEATNSIQIITDAMCSNTNVLLDITTASNIDHCPDGEWWKEINKIRFFNLRNTLIMKHPELESFIKQISLKYNMYTPGNQPISSLSLKCLVGSFLIFNPHVPRDNSRLPLELQEYIESLAKLQENLTPRAAQSMYCTRHIRSVTT